MGQNISLKSERKIQNLNRDLTFSAHTINCLEYLVCITLDEGQNDRESFQKTVESLQKSLQDKANVLKEKEESNSILRKEAMDLVARYVILPTKMNILI